MDTIYSKRNKMKVKWDKNNDIKKILKNIFQDNEERQNKSNSVIIIIKYFPLSAE